MQSADNQIAVHTCREELARQQAALIDALKCGQTVPPGFSEAQISVAAKSLAVKRAAGIRKAMPSLAEAIGNSFSVHLAKFTQTHPAPPSQGPRADALAFARWLQDQQLLPDTCLVEMQIAALSGRWQLKVVRLPGKKKFALIVKFPILGVRAFILPR